MAKSLKKKKLPKIYKFGGKELEELGLGLADNAITTVSGGAGANVITQDQYDSTKFGRSLGETEALKESMDSMNPVNKIYRKFDKTPQKTGYNQTQQGLYDQAQPIAKMGSSIGEMWAGKGMSSMANKPGTQGQIDAGQTPTGQGQNMFGSTMLSVGTNMISQPNPNDPNITGANSYGMKQQNPYFEKGGAYKLMHPLYDPMHIIEFPNGGNYSQGGNAQLEKQENTLNPDGSTTQFNLPSHEAQNAEEGTVLDPGTLIFSDKLKPRGSKKTFAILNKPNSTDKEVKILEDSKANRMAKATAQLMLDVKHKNSMKLFQEQEMLKQSKLNNYTKRLGGIQQFPEGGKVDAQGFPIDATGRRLSSQEQMGFNRPSNTYPSYTGNLQGNSTGGLGVNPNTGTAFLSLQNAGMNTGVKPLVPSGYQQTTPVVQNANESFEQAYQRTYGKPLYRGGGMMPKYGPGGYGPQTEQEANQYYVNNSAMPYIGNPSMRGMEFIGNPSYNYNNPQTNQDPNLAYKSPWDSQEGIDAMKGNSGNIESGGSNWKNMAYQLGSTLANSAGALSYLGDKANKTWDVEKERTYKPSLLDPTASLRDVDTQGRIARYDLADKSSGHAGNYLSNRIGLASSLSLAKDKIRREYGNMNSQISNRAKEFNANSLLTTDDRTAANKGKYLSNKYEAIGDLGANAAQGMKDYSMNQRDREMMEFMQFNDPAFQRKFEAYRKKKYGK